jgi:hypothetical protein
VGGNSTIAKKSHLEINHRLGFSFSEIDRSFKVVLLVIKNEFIF